MEYPPTCTPRMAQVDKHSLHRAYGYIFCQRTKYCFKKSSYAIKAYHCEGVNQFKQPHWKCLDNATGNVEIATGFRVNLEGSRCSSALLGCTTVRCSSDFESSTLKASWKQSSHPWWKGWVVKLFPDFSVQNSYGQSNPTYPNHFAGSIHKVHKRRLMRTD